MPTSYPGSLDSFSNPSSSSKLNDSGVVHSDQHANANDAIEAIEAELGLNPKGSSATVAARLSTLAPLASPTFTGTVTLPLTTAGYVTTTSGGAISSVSQIPISTGVGGLGTNVATFLATPTSANLASALTDETGSTSVVFSASPTFTGQITVPAGSTTTAPIIFQNGSLLTSAAGGRLEYDGRLFYLTPSTTAVGGRAVAQSTHYFALAADRNLTNVNTVQSIFGVGLTVQATTSYEIEMLVSVSTTGTTSNSLGISFGGTATLTSIGYQVEASQNATSFATLTAGSQAFINTAANTAVTAAVATATYRNIFIKGIVRVNGTGTFIPQLTYSAAPGVAPIVASNSYIKMTPIGSNTVTTVGAWA